MRVLPLAVFCLLALLLGPPAAAAHGDLHAQILAVTRASRPPRPTPRSISSAASCTARITRHAAHGPTTTERWRSTRRSMPHGWRARDCWWSWAGPPRREPTSRYFSRAIRDMSRPRWYAPGRVARPWRCQGGRRRLRCRARRHARSGVRPRARAAAGSHRARGGPPAGRGGPGRAHDPAGTHRDTRPGSHCAAGRTRRRRRGAGARGPGHGPHPESHSWLVRRAELLRRAGRTCRGASGLSRRTRRLDTLPAARRQTRDAQRTRAAIDTALAELPATVQGPSIHDCDPSSPSSSPLHGRGMVLAGPGTETPHAQSGARCDRRDVEIPRQRHQPGHGVAGARRSTTAAGRRGPRSWATATATRPRSSSLRPQQQRANTPPRTSATRSPSPIPTVYQSLTLAAAARRRRRGLSERHRSVPAPTCRRARSRYNTLASTAIGGADESDVPTDADQPVAARQPAPTCWPSRSISPSGTSTDISFDLRAHRQRLTVTLTRGAVPADGHAVQHVVRWRTSAAGQQPRAVRAHARALTSSVADATLRRPSTKSR